MTQMPSASRIYADFIRNSSLCKGLMARGWRRCLRHRGFTRISFVIRNSSFVIPFDIRHLFPLPGNQKSMESISVKVFYSWKILPFKKNGYLSTILQPIRWNVKSYLRFSCFWSTFSSAHKENSTTGISVDIGLIMPESHLILEFRQQFQIQWQWVPQVFVHRFQIH